jgi:hypothetical protein
MWRKKLIHTERKRAELRQASRQAGRERERERKKIG